MRRKHTFQPNLETLEGRELPATNVFVLDYTPDYRQAGSLYETFYNVKYTDGQVPRFFDFDGNRQLTPNDVSLAAQEITARVKGYFSNYLNHVSFVSGDVLRNDLLGHQWLTYGLKTNQVQVNMLYFGGRSAGGEFGRAPLAQEGYNVEGFGEVYVRTIALWMQRNTPNATPAEFAREVASTAAHELGHMLGLRHATSGASNGLMVEGRSRVNNVFTNQNVYTATGGVQNAHHEIWYSLQGQPTYYGVVNYGQPDIAPEDHHHDECGHAVEDHLGEEPEFAIPVRSGDDMTALDVAFSELDRQPNLETTSVRGEQLTSASKDVFSLPVAKMTSVIDSLFSETNSEEGTDLVATGLRKGFPTR